MKIKFIGIGRNKLSWETELPNAAEITICREVEAKRALMSRDIQAIHDNETNSGRIYAGMRPVGTYQVCDGGA